MRNFRTAAVAAATAVTVAFGGAAVASADTPSTNEGTSSSSSAKNEDANKGTSSSAKDENTNEGSSKSFTQLGKKWGAWEEGKDGKPVVKPENQVTGQDLFGKEKAKDNAKWAEIWRDGTFAALGTAVAGALIAAYNFAVYNNFVPAHVLDPIFRR